MTIFSTTWLAYVYMEVLAWKKVRRSAILIFALALFFAGTQWAAAQDVSADSSFSRPITTIVVDGISVRSSEAAADLAISFVQSAGYPPGRRPIHADGHRRLDPLRRALPAHRPRLQPGAGGLRRHPPMAGHNPVQTASRRRCWRHMPPSLRKEPAEGSQHIPARG